MTHQHQRQHPDGLGHSAEGVLGAAFEGPNAREHPHGVQGAQDGRGSQSMRRLSFVFGLTLTFMAAEAVGGFLTGSLALIADAGHMLTDALALAIALFAAWYVQQPAHPRHTFGPARVEVLAALANGLLLLGVSAYVMVEAIRRLSAPPEILGGGMLAIAVVGLAVNLCGLVLLQHAAENVNVKGALLHVAGDALGSVGTIVAGVLILMFGWVVADPIVSVLIGVLIIFSSIRLIRYTVDVLMEAAPARINLEAVRDAMLRAAGVQEVHDLHVWELSWGYTALSAHVVVSHDEHDHRCDACIAVLRDRLREEFDITHTTLQVETSPTPRGADCDTNCPS